MGNVTIDAGERASGASEPAAPHLGWVIAGCSAAAAAIHFAMVPGHAGGGLTDPLGFAITGWLQLAIAAAILSGRTSKRTYAAALIVNLGVIGLWAWSRTVGLPIGNHKNIVEPVAAIDLSCAIIEGIAVVVAARVLLAGEGRDRRLTPAFAAIAALAVATTVITSPDASSHGTTKAVDPYTAAKKQLDAERCDKEAVGSLNPKSYWKEAETVGVDTRWGGSPPSFGSSGGAVDESQPHSHSGGASVAAGGTTTTTRPDPTAGRGSPMLDKLISDTFRAGGGETAAAKLVADLSHATEKEYDSWLWWLKASGNIQHAHASTPAGSGDGGGHGGHVGPQVWTAMTNQKDCDRLAEELQKAQDVALKYDTVAKAEKAGWHEVTPYVPGIAAHYMNFDLVDGKFELTKPEMLLFDGTLPDSNIVGLSYYVIHDGDFEPTQGFTGPNDHGHRHIGLCIGNTGVIGDSTLTEAECAAIGGHKSSSSKAWMYHAWVVPGCESPWGVFSAATPILESGTTNNPGPKCAGSIVRERYGLAKVAAPKPKSKKKAAVSAPDKAKATDEASGDEEKPKSLKGN